jgi:hypothetical protein
VDVPYNVQTAELITPKDRLTVLTIPASLGFGHDLIEPDGENRAIIGKVYTVLGKALGVPIADPHASGSSGGTTQTAPANTP